MTKIPTVHFFSFAALCTMMQMVKKKIHTPFTHVVIHQANVRRRGEVSPYITREEPKLTYNCAHFTCKEGYAQNSPS